jgi:CBS domain-containing protein
VLAAGLGGSTAVADVMTPDPITIEGSRTAHDAQLVMVERNIHHLPIVNEDGRMIGVIHRNDLYKVRSNDPVSVAGEIAKAPSPDAIAAITARVPKLIEALVAADAQAEAIGRLVTSVTDAVTKRLCVLAETELGPPPMPYAFVCFGSQARREQTAFTDQDNALILQTDATGPAADYFQRLAEIACDGLAVAGYRYCPGDIMATNPLWRVGLETWKRNVASWVAEPDPEAVLNASVFFDCRHVHGDESLTDAYVEVTRAEAANSQLFLGQMAANASDFRPPLGFFRRFVVEKDGAQKDRFDLKRSGITPVVELGRVYALEVGAAPTNTYDRIRAVGQTPSMAPDDAADLAAAMEHIAYVRLQHQRRQLQEGIQPDNHVDPSELNRFERDQLKMAFVTIDRHQDAMRRRFNTGQMG